MANDPASMSPDTQSVENRTEWREEHQQSFSEVAINLG
jgi:hypothetical protein